ncbi:MAG TPA: spore coat U domain-containing protein [Steroidobacteraceae bacterium]|nr:spore coat U domain-containing protein [Steroidobacteraceae bacterium]
MLTAARALLLLALLALSSSATVWGATKTTTFLVQATITGDCTITATNLTFAPVSGLSATNSDATSSITATCTQSTVYNIGLNAGDAPGSTIANRLLANGLQTITYQMFRDNPRTQIWGNTVGTDTQSGTGTGSGQAITVYGRLFPQVPAPAPGVYSSTITVTITY